MKSSLMKLNYVSTFSGQGQPVILILIPHEKHLIAGGIEKNGVLPLGE
jgi:hypothetical protein